MSTCKRTVLGKGSGPGISGFPVNRGTVNRGLNVANCLIISLTMGVGTNIQNYKTKILVFPKILGFYYIFYVKKGINSYFVYLFI